MYAFNLITWKSEASSVCEFKANLVFLVSSRSAKAA